MKQQNSIPFFSIILPIYNVEQYIAECLISLTNQTFKEIEIICVIDGSPDSSQKICEQFAIKDHRLKVVYQENQGAAVARNTGIKNATGKYLHFVDPDDRIPNLEVYQRLYEILQTHNYDILVGRSNYYIDIFDEIAEKGLCATISKKEYNGLSFVLENNFFFALTSGANKIIRRDLVVDYELYWPLNVVNEDDRWLPRIAACSQNIIFTDLLIYDVRRRGGSLTSTKTAEHLIRRGKGNMQTALQNCALIKRTNCSKLAVRNGMSYYIQLYFTGYKMYYENSRERVLNLEVIHYMKYAGNIKIRSLYYLSKFIGKKAVYKIMEKRYGIE